MVQKYITKKILKNVYTNIYLKLKIRYQKWKAKIKNYKPTLSVTNAW